jgi:ribonuclease P protein component
MLSKNNRLSQDKDFKSTIKNGIRFNSIFSTWFYSAKKGHKKIGFIVSNKVSNKATRRNRIKRKLRGFISEKIDQLPEGYYVILIRKDFDNLKELVKDSKVQLSKIIK